MARIAVGNNNAFKYLSKRLQNNKDIALSAVKKSGSELIFASPSLRDDKELVKAAAIQYPNILNQVAEKFRKDDGFMRSIIEANGDAITLASAKLKDDKNLAIKSFLRPTMGITILQSLSDRLRDDEDVVEAAVKINQAYLSSASKRIKSDKKSALKLLSICHYPHMCVKDLSAELQQDPEILDLVKRREKTSRN